MDKLPYKYNSEATYFIVGGLVIVLLVIVVIAIAAHFIIKYW